MNKNIILVVILFLSSTLHLVAMHILIPESSRRTPTLESLTQQHSLLVPKKIKPETPSVVNNNTQSATQSFMQSKTESQPPLIHTKKELNLKNLPPSPANTLPQETLNTVNKNLHDATVTAPIKIKPTPKSQETTKKEQKTAPALPSNSDYSIEPKPTKKIPKNEPIKNRPSSASLSVTPENSLSSISLKDTLKQSGRNTRLYKPGQDPAPLSPWDLIKMPASNARQERIQAHQSLYDQASVASYTQTNTMLHDAHQSLEDCFGIAVSAGRWDYLESLAHNEVRNFEHIHITMNTITNLPLHEITKDTALHMIVQRLNEQQQRLDHNKHLQPDIYQATQHYEDLIKTLEFLLKNGADPNIQNSQGQTCLHMACKTGLYNVAKILAQHPSIELDIPDNIGRKPLDLINITQVKEQGYKKFVQLFETTRQHQQEQALAAWRKEEGRFYNRVKSFFGLPTNSGIKIQPI